MRLLLVLAINLPLLLSGQEFLLGQTYSSADGYVEYRVGNFPLILIASHGGDLRPANLPDRNCSGCVYINDSFTQELALEIQDAFASQIGCIPHVIINKLHRSKFDANRDLSEATDDNPQLTATWEAFHAFIDSAKNQTVRDFGGGLVIDVHGHGHAIQRLELGYLLTSDELRLTDETLVTPTFIDKSSIRNLVGNNISGANLPDLLRNGQSLGGLLETYNYAAVPSQVTPFPLVTEPYFRGGYNTDRHGSRLTGTIDAIQMECHQDIRFQTSTRQQFAQELALVLRAFMSLHYFATLLDFGCITSLDAPNETKLYFYPNPVDARIHFSFNPKQVIFRDVLGKIVAQRTLSPGQSDLSISHLPCGIYHIEIRLSPTNTKQFRLIKSCN